VSEELRKYFEWGRNNVESLKEKEKKNRQLSKDQRKGDVSVGKSSHWPGKKSRTYEKKRVKEANMDNPIEGSARMAW